MADPFSNKLMEALHMKNWDLTLKLIRRGEGLRWCNFGWTVLHFAMLQAAPRCIVIAMLRAGLSANECAMEDGKTPLHSAVMYNPESIPTLLEHNGDTNHADVC
jgi:hypothetical protein